MDLLSLFVSHSLFDITYLDTLAAVTAEDNSSLAGRPLPFFYVKISSDSLAIDSYRTKPSHCPSWFWGRIRGFTLRWSQGRPLSQSLELGMYPISSRSGINVMHCEPCLCRSNGLDGAAHLDEHTKNRASLIMEMPRSENVTQIYKPYVADLIKIYWEHSASCPDGMTGITGDFSILFKKVM